MRIVGWDPRHAPAFDRLNRAWLTRYFTVEPLDEFVLTDPVGAVIAKGGEIFFAIDDGGEVLGCCAAVPHGDAVELAKLAVVETAQGAGIGRALCETVLAWAEATGRPTFLITSARLTAARALYARLGFVERPFPFPPPYDEPDLLYLEGPVAP